MPSSQWRFAIRPSQAAQQSSVEGRGLARRISSLRMPMRTPRSSRICQCARPPPWSWSEMTSSLQAPMMRMRVSQSGQLVATLSLRTELRCRVFSRCCSANMRARPLVIGSRNQRQRFAKSSTTLSMRAMTLMRIPYQVRNFRDSSCEFECDPFVSFPFGPDARDLQRADFTGIRHVRAAARLQIDAGNLEEAHAAFAARRRDRHRAHELRSRVELRIGDPLRARRGGAAHQLIQQRFDRVLHQALHLDVEVEMRLVVVDAPAGDGGFHDRAEEMQRGVQPHQAMAPLPVEVRFHLYALRGIRARLEDVQHLVGQGAFARVDHPPGADPTCIAGLAATERIENGSVEL